MLPIIVIKRDSISKDRSVYNKLDANGPNLYQSWQKDIMVVIFIALLMY